MKILKSGRPELNKTTEDSHVCKRCSNFLNCEERGNMAYPIKVEGKLEKIDLSEAIIIV